jgi:hypothetical protein
LEKESVTEFKKGNSMNRLYLISLLGLILLSCGNNPRELDPLDYQISSADSTRCINEILDGILFEAREGQQFQKELEQRCSPVGTCSSQREIFIIRINSRGNVMIRGVEDSALVTAKVFEYFMFNRTLSAQETLEASVNPESPSFSFLFYYRFGRDEIKHKIEKTQEHLNEISKKNGVDPLLVDYYASKVDEWKVRFNSLELIGAESLDEVPPYVQVRVEYRKASDKSKEILRDVAFAFYQMRSYECLRYFNETYLSLYDRVQRKKRKLDVEKLEVLKLLHLANFYDNYQDNVPAIELQAPLPTKET